MKKIIFAIIVVLVVTLYLNFSYASIYKKIGDENMLKPNDFNVFQLGTKGDVITFVALGDSLTAGVGVDSYKKSFPYLIAEKFSKDDEKINLIPIAVPGAKSEDVFAKLIDETIKQKPNIITILVGVNDVHGNVSRADFKNNYSGILERLIKETSAKIYVVNLPYIGASELIKQPYRLYFDQKTKQFNKILEDLSVEYNTNYIDLYSKNKKQSLDSNYYARDLFHPNESGYDLWSEIIYASFNK